MWMNASNILSDVEDYLEENRIEVKKRPVVLYTGSKARISLEYKAGPDNALGSFKAVKMTEKIESIISENGALPVAIYNLYGENGLLIETTEESEKGVTS